MSSHSPAKRPTQKLYVRQDLYKKWAQLPLIPRTHQFKTIPLVALDEMGWRWTNGELGMGTGYFIPYFGISKQRIPFAQVRHLSGERRFTFLKDAKPTMYGLWNLVPNSPLFIVEGPSDCAVLEYCAVPYIGAPSAASGALVAKLGDYANKHGIRLIYAGDNDAAGDKLREALDETASYRVCQPPKKYKDWGDFLVAEGKNKVSEYCDKILFPPLMAWGSVPVVEPTTLL